jgi:MFS family permease
MALDVTLNETPEAPQDGAAAVRAPAVPWPSPAAAGWTLVMLSIVLGLSQLDRNILSLLLQSIKHDLKLNDTEMGLLTGAAFSSVYLILSYPLSLLSDRFSRKVMIALGVAVWSLSTAACGLASGFLSMFAARAGVGAGESVNAPATYSLLADSFPRERLTRAMATLNLGFVGGTALSLILGGIVIGALAKLHVVLPVLGALHNWQLVFLAVGLPGVLIAILMLTVKEPARRGMAKAEELKSVPFVDLFKFLFSNFRLYGSMFFSVFISGTVIYGAQNFRAAFFERTYHWPAQLYGVVVGVASLIASPIGLVAGAWLYERWGRRHHDANMRVALFANALAIPVMVLGPLAPNAWISVLLSAAGTALALMAAPPLAAGLQSIAPNRLRAQINSVYLMLFSGITGVTGPLVIGWLTDLQHDETKLNLVLAWTAGVGLPVAWAISCLGLKPFGRMIEAVKAREAAGEA